MTAKFVMNTFRENGIYGLLFKSKLRYDQSEKGKYEHIGVEELFLILSST